MIVCKFGGSCTTGEITLRNVKKIARNKKRKVFVFSAIGKGDDEQKLTDLLIGFCEEKNVLKKHEIHKKIIKKLQKLTNFSHVNVDFSAISNKKLNSHSKNYIISRGEYFTSKIMSQFLGVKFVPAEFLVCFENGVLSFEKTKEKTYKYLKKYGRFCTGGFYGFDLKTKQIILFNRGGGDTTGAVLAKVLDAETYENFTDVCGVKEFAPEIKKNAKTIKRISYQEMGFLSKNGTKVLHPSVCEILQNANTKTQVKSIFKPARQKTTIDNKIHSTKWRCNAEGWQYCKDGNFVKVKKMGV